VFRFNPPRDHDRGVGTDRLTAAEKYRANANRVDPVPNSPGHTWLIIAVCLDCSRTASICHLSGIDHRHVFGFKPLKRLRLEDMRGLPGAYVKTSRGRDRHRGRTRRIDKFGLLFSAAP